MRRQRLIAACLAAATILCSTAWAGLERLEPVAPGEPIPARVQREFDRRYGEEVKAALTTEAIEDDEAAADHINAEAARLRANPPLLACALDQVVRLASVCPNRQKLVYDTLKLQATESLRPALPCYEKMMLIVPHVAEQLGGEESAKWFEATCPTDARRLAMLADGEGKHAGAMAALTVARSAGEARSRQAAKAIADDVAGLEFLNRLVEARKQYEEDVKKSSGPLGQARVFLGIVTLVRDGDMDAALEHLKASGDARAEELAGRLSAVKGGASSIESAYEVARATVALADSVNGAYLQLLLYKEAEGKLSACLADPAFTRSHGGEAKALQQRVATRSRQAMDALPSLVQEQVKSIRQEASRDTAYVQTFFGVPLGGAKRVVYVIDRSGSMTDSMAYCKYELVRAVSSLKEDQQFQVMFYSSGPAVVMGNGDLAVASNANKKAAGEFIKSVVPIGKTDPSDALRRAFQLKPETIYLLTDGEFDNSIPGLLQTLNADGKVTIHAICFMYSNGEPALQEIARKHKGTYRFVDERDLAAADLQEFVTPKGDNKPKQPAQVVLRRAVPEGKPMPRSEEKKLERLIGYLQRSRGSATPASLEPSIKLVEGLLDDYGKHVPQKLRDDAEKILSDLKQDAAK